MSFVIFFTCSLPSFNDMSKHSLVLWLLLLLLLWGCFFFCFFFWGGGGLLCSFEKKDFFFFFFFLDGKSVMSVLCSCLCNEDRLED